MGGTLYVFLQDYVLKRSIRANVLNTCIRTVLKVYLDLLSIYLDRSYSILKTKKIKSKHFILILISNILIRVLCSCYLVLIIGFYRFR